MLSPDQIESAGDAVAAIYSDMEAQMLDHLVDVLLDVDRLDQRSITELNLLAQSMTADLTRIVEDNKAYIADEVYETCEMYLKASDKDDIKRLGEGGFIFPQQLAATVTGMQLVLDRQNIKMVEGAKTAFLNASIEAVTKVNSGLYTTEKALHAAVRKLEGDGIPIEYVTYQNPKTGKTTITNHVDVAVRRHIRTQIAQDGARMTLDRLNALDVALVEVSSHEGARPTHQAWEGRCYSLKGDIVIENTRYPDFYSATGYGQVDGLLGANCRHSLGPYRHGAPRAYKPDPKSETGLSNDDIYQLTQKQRHLERKIRDNKRQLRGAQLEYEKNPDKIENKTNLIKAKDTLAKRQKQMRDFIADSNAKCKKGTTVLHRNPRREWAGDMPKGVKINASHRNLDDFLTSRSAQLKNAGISKTRMKAAISSEMAKRGGKASDFSSLTGAEQDNLFKKLKNSIDAKLPSTKKANAGKHVKGSNVQYDNLFGERFPKIQGKITATNQIAKVNPHWGEKGYKENCQRCVIAYEMRCRGWNVEVQPAGKYEEGDSFRLFWPNSFEGGMLARKPIAGEGIKAKQAIEQTMTKYGEGSRAIVSVMWKPRYKGDKPGGHVFIVQNDGDRIRFVDPQTGDIDYTDWENRIKKGKTDIYRIDDKESTALVLNAIIQGDTK